METMPSNLLERDEEQEVSIVRKSLQEWVDTFTLGDEHVHLSATQAQIFGKYGDRLPAELEVKIIELGLSKPICAERLNAWTHYVHQTPIHPEG